jgi:hypothetical protein
MVRRHKDQRARGRGIFHSQAFQAKRFGSQALRTLRQEGDTKSAASVRITWDFTLPHITHAKLCSHHRGDDTPCELAPPLTGRRYAAQLLPSAFLRQE